MHRFLCFAEVVETYIVRLPMFMSSVMDKGECSLACVIVSYSILVQPIVVLQSLYALSLVFSPIVLDCVSPSL